MLLICPFFTRCITYLGVQSVDYFFLSTLQPLRISSDLFEYHQSVLPSLVLALTFPELHICISDLPTHFPAWRSERHFKLNRSRLFLPNRLLPHPPHFSEWQLRPSNCPGWKSVSHSWFLSPYPNSSASPVSCTSKNYPKSAYADPLTSAALITPILSSSLWAHTLIPYSLEQGRLH